MANPSIRNRLMTLRPPATAILTVTLLATASASPAWAQVDCEQLRQNLVGQYGVVLRYTDGVVVVTKQCNQIMAAKVVDTTAFAQCSASLENLQAGYQQTNATYQQTLAWFNQQCEATANYGQPGQPAAPTYAKDTVPPLPAPDPWSGQPSAANPNPGQYAPQPTTYTSPTYSSGYTPPPTDTGGVAPSYFATEDDAGVANAIIGAFGGLGRRGGGSSRGGGSKKPC
jgi:hypothetical protein